MALQVLIDMLELQQLVLSIHQNGLQQTQAAYAAVSSSSTAGVSAGHSNYMAGLLLSATEQHVEQVGRIRADMAL
jgi:cystathionine beta-lyase/cystathionine gamma-synthase